MRWGATMVVLVIVQVVVVAAVWVARVRVLEAASIVVEVNAMQPAVTVAQAHVEVIINEFF